MANAEDLAEVMDPPMEETPAEIEAPVESEPTEAEKPDNQKEVETLLAQKEHWRNKALKAEEEAKKLRASSKPEGAVPDEEFRPRVEFLLENRDLDADEYDHLATAALRNSGKITLEALRDAKESEKKYITFLRKERSQKSKIPGSTSTTGFSKYQKSPEEIGKMTGDEIRAYDKLMMENQNTGI